MVGENCFEHAACVLFPIAQWLCVSQIRGKMRREKGIKGTGMNDCLLSVFCNPCLINQMANEVQSLDQSDIARV